MVTVIGYKFNKLLLQFLRVSQNSQFFDNLLLKTLDHPTIIMMFHLIDVSLLRNFSDGGSIKYLIHLVKKCKCKQEIMLRNNEGLIISVNFLEVQCQIILSEVKDKFVSPVLPLSSSYKICWAFSDFDSKFTIFVVLLLYVY